MRLFLWLLACAMGVGSAGAQQIAFTFDDLPSHGPLPPGVARLEIADSILATLKKDKMPPTYGFVNGRLVEKEPGTEAVLKAWRDAGQPLGSHSWSHPNLEDITAAEFDADIEKDESMLKTLMAGQDWHWFRYPYLHEGETVEKRREVRAWLFAHDYKIAQVTMSFGDYLWNEPYARCKVKHDDAAIARLHDSYLAAADQSLGRYRAMSKAVYGRDIPYVLLMHIGAFDARMLPELLALYRSRGVSFVSLPEAEKDPAYKDDPDLGMKGGGALLEQMMVKKQLPFPANSSSFGKELDAMCR
jgi:peptidoglycan-N-acetylglucosamine deacetylase